MFVCRIGHRFKTDFIDLENEIIIAYVILKRDMCLLLFVTEVIA